MLVGALQLDYLSMRAVYETRASTWDLAGVNGRLVVHMCQMVRMQELLEKTVRGDSHIPV
jgi:hypothetical protein